MQHKDVFLLETIIEYCEKLSSLLKDKEINNIDDFLKDTYSQDTCAFYCLQIGETANSLSEQFTTTHIEIEWRNIIGLRNQIAHEYGSIDSKILWTVVDKNIPELYEYCKKVVEL